MSTNELFIEMTEDEWIATYKPILNHIDTNASFDGTMFETYDEEVEFVKSQPNEYIWTFGDGDDGGGYVWNGWSFINRIGYFITEVPCPPDVTIQVLISVPCYFCETCDTEWDDPDNLIRDMFQEWDLDKCPNCASIEEIELVGWKAQ
jgi:hypothetical protein